MTTVGFMYGFNHSKQATRNKGVVRYNMQREDAVIHVEKRPRSVESKQSVAMVMMSKIRIEKSKTKPKL
jgi:ribosomal protein L28